ncbi:LD-carboxypeptidase [Streptomyces rubellomurinus]|uniref:LD-carboxypeptidase n=1 Tax=Streptomyces sp. Y1 TaxID=3238634 RepID=A0AB39TNN1_9ACTN|nr:peptidase U61 [Streptomyces rubellomurinus subsp. indigoferus]
MAQHPTPPGPGLTRPPHLRPGDHITVVATSGPIDPVRLTAGCEILRSWGLRVTVAPHVLDTHPTLGYLAGTDADRAADLQAAWLDPTVDAVISARGGYGVHRMVDLLDWTAMAAVPPKAFIGFSDVSSLHEAFAQRLGLATLYGPLAAGAAFVDDGPTAEHLRRTLFDPAATTVLTSPTATPLVGGRARGVTAGGCVHVLAAERGTPAARPSFAGSILVLEDVNEHPYQLDRLLTQFLRSGALDGVAGIALGSWEGCGRPDRVRQVMLDRLGPLGIPVLWELGFGHCPSSLTVPLGVPALLDADAGTLTLDLPALATPAPATR